MQTALKENIKLIKSKEKFPKETVPYLLQALETADNNMKARIENKIVEMGENAVEDLVIALKNTGGSIRGTVAMALIRIGNDCIEPLKNVFYGEKRWVADYIINEINGSKISVCTRNNYSII
ncbi:MAG: hypothetical protein PHV68_08370 [Candidatus Gastranaerophilales bacterium]|nr:hypothetical protein [Candidatus Gastranaerophilales bacterium]